MCTFKSTSFFSGPFSVPAPAGYSYST